MKKLSIKKLPSNRKLTLKNSGQLSFFWVGCGSAFSKTLYQNNPLIIKGDNHLLIDCGTGCAKAFHQYGLPIFKLENYLITHSHADHIGGLEEVALMGRYFIKRRPKMILTEDYQNLLWDHSLKGGCGFNERNNGELLDFEDLFEPVRPALVTNHPREILELQFDNLNIKLFRTMHVPDSAESWRDSFLSYGVIVDESVVFSSDTRFDKDLLTDLLSLYPQIDTIFHDCQFFKGGVHASYEELKTLPDEIKSKIFLMHYGDNFEQFHPEKEGFGGFVKQGYYFTFET